jgi:ArsR family metal-binding transcriptional regulator
MEECRLINEYEVALDYPGCHAGSDLVIAKITVDHDLTGLLPYLNATAEKAKYNPNFNWLKFRFHGYPERRDGTWDVVVCERKVLVRIFKDGDFAREICAEVIAFLNDFALRKDDITPSYKEWVQPKAIDIYKYLPRSNCKKSGLPTCLAFATKLVMEDISLDDCPELPAESEKYLKISDMIL